MRAILSNWCNKYFSDPEAFAILAIILIAIIVLKTIGSVVAPILISIIITYILLSLVKQLERWRFPHLFAVIFVYVIFLGILFLISFWLLPLLWQQLVSFFSNFPQIINNGQILLINLHNKYPALVSLAWLKQMTSGLTGQVTDLGKFVFTFSRASITGILSLTIYVVLVPILIFFFLKDSAVLIRWAEHFLPQKRTVLSKVWVELGEKIGRYVKGKIIEILIVGLVSEIVFSIAGLSYALLLGAMVGVSVIVPYAGAIIVTIPIVIVGLVQWGLTAHFLYLMIAYGVIVTLDANILVPILFSEAMNLHPAAILIGILIFGSLGGFWGVFFAIPLLTLFNILLKAWPRSGNKHAA
jgi:putative permease